MRWLAFLLFCSLLLLDTSLLKPECWRIAEEVARAA